MRRASSVAILTLAACATAAPPPAPTPVRPAPLPTATPPALRLPTTVEPTGYALRLEVDPDREDFRGHVDIDVRFTAPVDHIWLHAQALGVTAPAITVGGQRRALTPLPARTGTTVGFALGGTVAPGPATLHFDFTGKAPPEEMSGLFREQEGGRWYLYSQLESVFARRVFPSFDEPRFKVPWRITLVVPAGQVALSNAPAERETRLADGRVEIAFAPTLPLPSYLVAIAVGPFELVDVGPVGRNRIPARVAVLHGTAADARWAVATTPRLVAALEDYFDMPVPYPKLDQVVVPRFFGAMENPGLITYAASILVAPADKETDEFRRGFVAIGGHELAHQCFGNLVTPAWWDDTWLDESFATWMANKAGAAIDQGWDVAIRLADEADEAMSADASQQARPLRRAIDHQDDIEGAFDAIAYEKGGAVLSMFERWIGADRFRDGVRAYVRRHAHATATADDFLAALAAVSTPDAGRAFRAFLDRPGVPLVRARLSCAAGSPPALVVSQARLTPVGDGPASGETWPLPVCVRYPGARGTPGVIERCTLVETAEASLPLETRTCPAWVVANAGAAGYYRVAYEPALVPRLVRAASALQPAERLALAADTLALVELGHADVAAALELARPLTAQRDEHSLLGGVRLLRGARAMVDPAHRPGWERAVRDLLGGRARAAGFAPLPAGASTATRAARRELVALVALGASDPALLARARPLADTWLTDRRGIAPDMIEVVLPAAARGGDAALFDRMEAAAKATPSRAERNALLVALGSFREPALVERALRLAVDGPFHGSEIGVTVDTVFSRPENEAQAWAFFQANYDAISARLPAFARGYLAYAASDFCTVTLRREADAFFRPRAVRLANGARVLDGILEQIDRCVARRARSAEAVQRLFGPKS